MSKLYGGWHGITDHLHILVAVSYAPLEGGMLSCRMCSGPPVTHIGVPEEKFHILLRSKFAGSYYRKHIRNQFPIIGQEIPEPYQGDETAAENKLERLAIKAADRPKSKPQLNLF